MDAEGSTEERRRSRRATVESNTGNRNLRDRLPAIVAAAASLILSLAAFSNYSSRGENGIGLITTSSWTAASERLRWSPQMARVHNLPLGQSASRNMLALFQQQQWASHFDQLSGTRRMPDAALATHFNQLSETRRMPDAALASHFDQLSETRRMPDEALSSYLARKGRYPESRVHDESMELEQHPPASVNRMTKLSYKEFRPSSSFDDPGDFSVHQHYEFVPASDGGGDISDKEGMKLWKDLQKGYRDSHPSTSTYPAVPVVFNEDRYGGHPAAQTDEDDDTIVDDVGFHTPYENTEQGKRPQLTSRSVGGASTATPQLFSLVHGETEKKVKKEAEPSGGQVKAVKASVVRKESPEQKLYDWERAHHVDDKAAYRQEGKPPASSKNDAASRRHAEEEAMKMQDAEVKKQEVLLQAERKDLMQLKQKLTSVEQKQQSTAESTQQLQDELKYLHSTTAPASAQQPARDSSYYARDSQSSSGDREVGLGLKSHRQAEADALKTAVLSQYTQAGAGGERHEQEGSQAAGGGKTGARDEDPIPRAVLSEAKEMVKNKVTTELAQAEEASETRDAAFIMGGGKHQHANRNSLAVRGEGRSSGFSQLHAIEASVLSKLAAPPSVNNTPSKDVQAEMKEAAAKRLKDKKVREVSLEKALSHEAIKGHSKELKKDESVRERALAFVQAFSKKA